MRFILFNLSDINKEQFWNLIDSFKKYERWIAGENEEEAKYDIQFHASDLNIHRDGYSEKCRKYCRHIWRRMMYIYKELGGW